MRRYAGIMVGDVRREPSSLRDVTRRAVKAEIAAKALQLFLAQGFQETTVNQIAAEVGTSARNVFRYFDSKEDMVISDLDELGHEVATALARQPAHDDPWTALRGALQVCVDDLQHGQFGLPRAEMLANTPALRTAMVDKQRRWQTLLVPLVLERLARTGKDRELRAGALVSAALSCLDVAATEWTRIKGERPLAKLVDTAFAAVRP